MAAQRPTRREFLYAAGALTAGGAMLGTAGCSWFSSGGTKAATAPTRTTYRSRPDLSIPILTTSKAAVRTTAGLLFAAPGGGLMIADSNGEPVWFHPVPNKNVADFQAQTYRGAPVLTWWEGKVGVGYGLTGEAVIADASYTEIQRISGGHGYQADLHDFQITDRDTVLITVYTTMPANLSAVGGPSNGQILDGIVQELDPASGQVLFEWHSLDHVAMSESHATYTKGQPYDYFHINSIGVDHDNNLLVSARNTWAIYKIDRTTGAVIWRLGGKKTDFAMGSDTNFAWQHDARRQADGSITLFDDEGAPKEAPESRGMVLDVDEVGRSVSLRKAYTHHPGILASSQGNVQVLPNGNVMVGWGSQPNLTEFDAAGNVVLDGTFAGTLQSYRAFVMPWTGKPTDTPAIAAVRGSGGATVYASWNGATNVVGWQVLGGAGASSLQPIASEKRSGFETAISVNSQPGMAAVQALDALGAVLGTSKAISV